ncbi:type II secretion system minor pseudopilin GspJ [Sphingomonas profundi]|uniref:type II secretion system minor pseudopilin GspJ n=1 Tax=Alterirhizorhabdus profundi TaxID=2681549 RepID=UPI001E4F25F3|nr:type II secretion system minor pseudopilin GspJ [Sphingomonas profundi]
MTVPVPPRPAGCGFEGSPRSTEHGFEPSQRSAEHGFELSQRSAEHGFTLIELMVALFVFGLLAAAGVALLGFSARAQGAAGEKLAEIAAIRRVSAILTADLAQAAPRISRSASGAAQVAFFGSAGGDRQVALAFVRRGWENPYGAPRASLQKVQYRLVGDRLERSAAPMLDGAEPGPPAVIIRGVRSMSLRYRLGGEWRERWDATRADAVPRAVEMVLDIDGIGPVRQVFQTGTGL